MTATARIERYFGSEVETSSSPAAVASESSAGAAPTNGVVVPRRLRAFDSSTDETLCFVYKLPSNYSSGATLNFDYSTNATSGNVIFKTAWGLSTLGTTDFDAIVFGTVTAHSANAVPGTAGIEKAVSLDLGVTGATAGQRLYVMFGRDANNASDTVNSNDIELLEPWVLTFTVI